MNLSQLRYFSALAHEQHYGRAAERLHITQPTLSYAIRGLEKELGVSLFEKTGRSNVLTSCGSQFLDCVDRTLETLDEGLAAVQRTAQGEGRIRLGFLRTLGVDLIPELAAGFLAERPGKNVRFEFVSGPTPALLEQLKVRKLDLVFASPPDPASGLTAEPVSSQDLVLIVPRDHPLAGREDVDLAETRMYPFVFFSPTSGLRSVVEELFSRAGGPPEIACEAEEDQVVAGLVARNFGIAVVPRMEILSRLAVKVLAIRSPAWERRFCMICDDRFYVPPVVADFRAYVRAHCPA